MSPCRPLLAALVAVCAPLEAQRANDNAITAAEDAFGATIGNESIGLYSASQVRGFSPTAAGNVRIEGLYLDRQGSISTRLIEGSAIRVGPSAISHPFPAPTGIVDYRLRKPGDQRIVSVLAGLNAYAAPSLEVDAKLPIIDGRFGVSLGASIAHEEYYDGADALYTRFAVIPRWRPNERVEIIPFWSVSRGRDEEVAPVIITSGNFLPPEIRRRRFFGQSWSDNETENSNHGLITKARIGADWALAAGVFHSISDTPRGFAELYVNTTEAGSTRELLIADPRQRYAATSGELRLTRGFLEGQRLHLLHGTLRARDQSNVYGGSAAPLDYGIRPLGTRIAQVEPASFDFSARTRDGVRQWTAGLGYEGRWKDRGELSVGIQRTDYEKTIRPPELPITVDRDRPWLGNIAAAIHVNAALAVYAGASRGLEESGIAPDDALNRNQALPAIRTRQFDGGLRWNAPLGLKVIAGYFDVEKPYFATTEDGAFEIAGDVQHRGLELSVSGKPVPSLSLVAGAVLMDPRVKGDGVRLGVVGDRPVGQTDRVLRANLEYRPAIAPGWSFDLAAAHVGRRTASRDAINETPSYTTLDLGTRYRFELFGAPSTLRIQIANVTDTFYWAIFSSNSFGLTDGRRAVLQLASDF
jgi:iron complex outermembrane receptor protein